MLVGVGVEVLGGVFDVVVVGVVGEIVVVLVVGVMVSWWVGIVVVLV